MGATSVDHTTDCDLPGGSIGRATSTPFPRHVCRRSPSDWFTPTIPQRAQRRAPSISHSPVIAAADTMLCFLCSGDPVEDDIRKDNGQRFAIGMMQAPGAEPLCCLASCVCPCCAQIYIRRKALHYDMSKYSCCQGYMDGFVPGLTAGQCGESSCPNACLCLEAFACNGCAVSATRLMVMDRHNLRPDEWDNRIIRFNNCIQLASVVCQCLAICVPAARDVADSLQCIAQCTYASTQGCMTAQINVELDKREDFAPMTNEVMERA